MPHRLSMAGLLILALSSGSVTAQVLPNADPGSSVRTRADLERLVQEYQSALSSPAYSEGVKRSLRADLRMVQARLTEGDFRVGDRIALFVQGEPDLPDTIQVQPGPLIALPLFGEIPLQGVLRSEITVHLAEALSRFIRAPVVRANGLMRLSVQGSVGQPGLHWMPAEMLLEEALMAAGGPSPQADMDAIRIQRGSQVLLEGEPLQEAFRQGLTLDQLNLQAGDQIIVPLTTPGGSLRNLGIIAGIAGSLTTLIVIFVR